MKIKTEHDIGDTVMVEEYYYPTIECDICDGTGRIMLKGNTYECPECNGKGQYMTPPQRKRQTSYTIDKIIITNYRNRISVKYGHELFDMGGCNDGWKIFTDDEIID